VVSLQVTAIAYLHAPRWKALILGLPFPFTTIVLTTGRPVDVTNVLGLLVFLCYLHGVRLLYQGLRLPIVPAIGLGLAGYCGLSAVAIAAIPNTPTTFWAAAAAAAILGLGLYLGLPHRQEPGHRTPLAIWLKLPVIAAVVGLLLLIKEQLQGFATFFPMVAVVGVYEARHSLWTLSRQIPVMILTMVPLMAVSYVTRPHLGLTWSLGLGWAAFLAVLVPLTVSLWTRPEMADLAGADSSAAMVGDAAASKEAVR
jgi:hypothetical protein